MTVREMHITKWLRWSYSSSPPIDSRHALAGSGITSVNTLTGQRRTVIGHPRSYVDGAAPAVVDLAGADSCVSTGHSGRPLLSICPWDLDLVLADPIRPGADHVVGTAGEWDRPIRDRDPRGKLKVKAA